MKFECCKATSEGTSGSIVCTKCKRNYHLQCLDPTDKNSTTSEIKKLWLCPVCSAKQPRQPNNDNTPIRSTAKPLHQEVDNVSTRRGAYNTSSSNPSEHTLTAEMIRKIVASEVSKIKDDIRSHVSKIISQELKPIKAEIENVKSSLCHVSDQFESLTKRMDKIETDMKTYKSLNLDLNSLKSAVVKLESLNSNCEQWSRRSNIEIYGIPEKKSENLFDILKILSERAQYGIDPKSDIDFITRVAPKKSDSRKTKPILIRFLARYKKDDFLSRLRKLKLKASDIGFSACDNPIFFNEHLTSSNKSLLQQTKTIAKEKQYAYVWVKNCAIFARRNDTSPVINISTDQDLNKLK